MSSPKLKPNKEIKVQDNDQKPKRIPSSPNQSTASKQPGCLRQTLLAQNPVIDRHPDDFSLEVFKQEYDYYSRDLLDEMEPGFMNYIQTFFEDEGMPNLGDVLANSRWGVSLYEVIRDLKMAIEPDLYQHLIDHCFHYAPPYFPLHQFIEIPLRPPLAVLTVMHWQIPATRKGFSDFMGRNYPQQNLAEMLGQIDKCLKGE